MQTSFLVNVLNWTLRSTLSMTLIWCHKPSRDDYYQFEISKICVHRKFLLILTCLIGVMVVINNNVDEFIFTFARKFPFQCLWLCNSTPKYVFSFFIRIITILEVVKKTCEEKHVVCHRICH